MEPLNVWPKRAAAAGWLSALLLMMLLMEIGRPIGSLHTSATTAAATGSRGAGGADEHPEVGDARQVSNLRLAPDYRAARLHWSHAAPEPATSFNVRYCELTSWNVEIKCRRKELRVITGPEDAPSSAALISGHSPAPQDVARQVAAHEYAAQIYDLRALTNYTFQVWPSRARALRRLEGLGDALADQKEEEAQSQNAIQRRVETKPFTAEATRCLANSSEVLVTTGKYFGGRISVEDSADPRCSLLGNKSSEQTSYLFRIDHEACESKLTNGNRVEAMILVHENKDILTHNTARFLVLCNFQQAAFTLRASVSLPKVQGTGGGSRPALISPISSREAHAVTLGSMPGIFRARALPPSGELPAGSESSSRLVARTPVDELETNRIAASERGLIGSKEARRAPKELGLPRLPEPVQVQSRLLFVEQPAERLWGGGPALRARALTGGRSLLLAATEPRHSAAPIESAAEPEEQPPAGAPIIITNNHRTMAAAGSAPDMQRSRPDDRSIRHGGAGDEYSVQPAAPANPLLPGSTAAAAAAAASLRLRSRAGRMRTMDGQLAHLAQPAPAAASAFSLVEAHTHSPLLNKMGELSPPEVAATARAAPDLLPLDSSQPAAGEPAGFAVANASLAHNITSYLLKWSLRTLTNLARRSLESLVPHPKLLDGTANSSLLGAVETHSPEAGSESSAPTPPPTRQVSPRQPATKTPSETRPAAPAKAAGRALELDGFLISAAPPGAEAVLARFSQQPSGNRSENHLSEAGPVSQRIARTLGRSSWLIYALPLVAGLALALLLSLCLVAVARPRRSRHADCSAATRAQPARDDDDEHLSPGADHHCQTIGEHTGYHRYDYNNKFDSDTINKRALLADDAGSPRSNGHRGFLHEDSLHRVAPPHSPAQVSSSRTSTRSTCLASATGAAAADEHSENDCKNSEFFYTEHVLINTGTNFGESYA